MVMWMLWTADVPQVSDCSSGTEKSHRGALLDVGAWVNSPVPPVLGSDTGNQPQLLL